LTPRKRNWLVGGGVALVAVLFLAVFPARTYLDQHRQRQQVAAELKATEAKNKALEQRVQSLNTDSEVERLAREQYNLVRPGEEAYAILPTRQPPAPARPAANTKVKSDSGFFGRTWHTITSIF